MGILTQTQMPGKSLCTISFTAFSKLSCISFLSSSLPLSLLSCVPCYAHYSHSWMHIIGRLLNIYACFFLVQYPNMTTWSKWLAYCFSLYSTILFFPFFFSVLLLLLSSTVWIKIIPVNQLRVSYYIFSLSCLVCGLKNGHWPWTLCLHLVVWSVSAEILNVFCLFVQCASPVVLINPSDDIGGTHTEIRR